MSLLEQMTQLGRQARVASRALGQLTTARKNACLIKMAEALESPAALVAIQAANSLDMTAGAANGLSSAMLDRLKLDPKRIAGMANGLLGRGRFQCLGHLEQTGVFPLGRQLPQGARRHPGLPAQLRHLVQ